MSKSRLRRIDINPIGVPRDVAHYAKVQLTGDRFSGRAILLAAPAATVPLEDLFDEISRSQLPDKGTYFCYRIRGFRQKGRKALKHMGHAVPNLKRHRAAMPGSMRC